MNKLEALHHASEHVRGAVVMADSLALDVLQAEKQLLEGTVPRPNLDAMQNLMELLLKSIREAESSLDVLGNDLVGHCQPPAEAICGHMATSYHRLGAGIAKAMRARIMLHSVAGGPDDREYGQAIMGLGEFDSTAIEPKQWLRMANDVRPIATALRPKVDFLLTRIELEAVAVDRALRTSVRARRVPFHYDADGRTLYIDGKIVKVFAESADRQTEILSAFEAGGWGKITNPIIGRNAAACFTEGIKQLNKTLKSHGRRISRDGKTAKVVDLKG